MRLKEYTIKLSDLNAMTVEAHTVVNGDGVVEFKIQPPEGGPDKVILTVSKDSLEYFGIDGHFKLQSRKRVGN